MRRETLYNMATGGQTYNFMNQAVQTNAQGQATAAAPINNGVTGAFAPVSAPTYGSQGQVTNAAQSSGTAGTGNANSNIPTVPQPNPPDSTTNPLLPNPLTPPTTLANGQTPGSSQTGTSLAMPTGDAANTVFDPTTGKQVSPGEAALNSTKTAMPAPPQDNSGSKIASDAIVAATPPDPKATTSPAVDSFYNESETVQQNTQDLMNFLSPPETTKMLIDQLAKITSDQNILSGLNVQAMNITNVMNGSASDLSNEILAGGGIADQSKIDALAISRNKVLQTQATLIQNSITNIQNAIANDTTLFQNEKDMANTQFSQRSSAYQLAVTNHNQIVSAQKDTANTIISAIGYAGYLTNLQAQGPQAVATAEKALGLGAGGLQNLVATQTAQLNANAIANAGITTPFVNKNGEIQSATGYAYTSEQDFFNKTGMTLQQAQAKGMISAMQPSLDIQAKKANIAQSYAAINASNASAANSAASAAKTRLETEQLQNPTSDNLNTVDPTSNSIMAQTGLSYNAFLALTGQMSSLPRDKATRDKATAEVQAWANKNGVDVSTFASQYKALNDTLGKNISRANNTKIFAGEVTGTVDQFVTDIGNDFGSLKAANVAKVFAGQELNDKTAQKYAFDLQTMKNDLAGYYAASRGNTQPDDSDKKDAERVILNGLNAGSAKAFKDSITANEQKVIGVVSNATTSANKQVWDLFGVGDNYGKTGSQAPTAPLNIGSTGSFTSGVTWKIIQ